jgi:putative NADH-flavin reductase
MIIFTIMNNTQPSSVVMLGASGAVGTIVVQQLLPHASIANITLLNRKNIDTFQNIIIKQHNIDIHNSEKYASFINHQTVAICTLGVGEPSKVSKEEFIKVDKTAVVHFANICKEKGVEHFQLLACVNQNTKSANHYLKVKGELVAHLQSLQFNRLSIFEPSMILTPTNRYGFSQALMLAVWPKLHFLLQRSFSKYRGIEIEKLGKAIANNTFTNKTGDEFLTWNDFLALAK